MTKILIVDEAELLLKLERSFLRRSGFEILLARSPHELFEKARHSLPDLVLLHSGGHGGECGIPCARRLKESPETSGIPIILIRPRDASRADPHLPCERVVDSPVDPHELLEAVSSLARVRHRIQHRVPVSLPVEVRAGSAAWKSRTKDVSAEGLFILTCRPLDTGTPVRVDLRLPDPEGLATVSARGVVVRTVPDDPSSDLIAGNGVRLVDVDTGERKALEEFLMRRGAAP
jgi:uncharacterized protein (TIGR02266 family)